MLDKFRETFPRSIASSAIMFGSVAYSFATAGTPGGLAAFIEMCASLASNLTASDLYKIIADRINSKDILANGALAKACADAICSTITYTARKPEHSQRRHEILLLVEDSSDLLQRLLHGEAIQGANAAQRELAALSGRDFVDIFMADPENFPGQKSKISIEGWEQLILWLAVEKQAVMSHDTTRAVAADIYDNFPRVFLEVIKDDFDNGGQAYVALQHQISNRMLSGLKEIFAAVSVVSQQVANVDERLVGMSQTQARMEALLARVPLDVAKEVRSLWQTYEDDAARRATFERVAKEHLILKLKDSLHNHLRDILYNDARNTFFHKYVPSTIYHPRQEAEFKFQEFLAQSQERCFVAIAKAGIGKTCLMCRLAESLAFHNSEFLPLLMSAESAQLTSVSADELADAIAERIRAIAPPMPGRLTLQDFGEFLKENGLHMIVFIDGLNELQGSDSYSNFNAQFERLTQLVVAHSLPIHFALTCRYEWWQYFSTSRWAEKNIYAKNVATQATVVLEPPSEKEVKQLSEKYFEYFALKGELKGEAVRTCQTLLMLRFLCDAYTNRPINNKNPQPAGIKPYELKEVSSFKKKEILKRYVAARRESFVEFVRTALYGRSDIDASVSSIYRLTTLYIINIANFMYQKRVASVTSEEVFRIAEVLRHPDAALRPEKVASSSKSFFQRLIDLGIFSRSEKNAQEFSFVYETYFEFSLGRYIAFVRWRDLTGGTLENTAIEADLDDLIGEHTRLRRDSNFSNLFGAIQFAVLATEAGDWIDWNQLPDEEKIYREHPLLFSQLISRLAGSKEGFDWLQQACAIIRESELAKRETWGQNSDQDNFRESFDELLGALDKLANTTDFVLLWDIENTLKTLAQANLGLTLSRLTSWAESGDSLKTIFAAQVISALAPEHPKRVLRLLLEWMKNAKFRSNFWIVRSLLFAASEFTRAYRHSNLEDNDDWLGLRTEIHKLLAPEGGMSPYIASRALSLLPSMSLSQETELERIDSLIERRLNGRDSWQLLNLVFNLSAPTDSLSPRVEAWVLRALDKMAGHQNHHLLYAIEKALDSVGKHVRADQEASKIRAEIEGKLEAGRWSINSRPEVHARGRMDKVGVVYTPKYLEPDYENHVECRERLIAILNKLEGCGEENFVWITPREANDKELEKVHNVETDRHRDGSIWGDYIKTIFQASEKLGSFREQLERSGPSELRFESFEIAKTAAGGVIEGIDYVLNSDAPAAFVLNRPPGHLANNTICIFNNIAVGAHYAMSMRNRKMRRILIVDCDAHHGKHTQKVFYRSPHVVYFSMHIDGDYAREDGMIKNAGEGAGSGYTFNIPYPPWMGDEGYQLIIDRLLLPVASDFRPDLILLSAGFDGHFDDPLTPACLLSERSYIHLARTLKEIAGRHDCKIVCALEGGYALEGMPHSLAQMLNVWGSWGLENEIGYIPKPVGYDELLDPDALDLVRRLVAARVKIMRETKRQDDSYFFDPDALHWRES